MAPWSRNKVRFSGQLVRLKLGDMSLKVLQVHRSTGVPNHGSYRAIAGRLAAEFIAVAGVDSTLEAIWCPADNLSPLNGLPDV